MKEKETLDQILDLYEIDKNYKMDYNIIEDEFSKIENFEKLEKRFWRKKKIEKIWKLNYEK